MISEEIGLNHCLEEGGIEVVETDLGEYLIQIRGETPSHIIAPAIHLTQEQVEADFRRLHTNLPKERMLAEPTQLVAEARQILREKFLAADVGITGANFLIAETGSSVIVTNEGNGDLTQSLPKVHIVLASIDKLVPTLEDTNTLIRLLARSATGQEISTYTTFSTGPRRAGDPDGPEACHVVILGQRPLGAARQRVPRGAALHPLRRLHEPLSGLRRHRRPCLRLGVSRPDRRGADAGAHRRAHGGAPAQRLHLLRALRGGVPDEDPAAGPDAAVAQCRVQRGRQLAVLPAGPEGVGGGGEAAAPLSCAGQDPDADARHDRAARGIVPLAAAGAAAGRGIATFPRRRGARSRRCGPTPRRECRDECAGPPRRRHLQDPQGAGDVRFGGAPGCRSGAASATPPAPLVPERAKGGRDGLRQLFRKFLEGQSATVIEVASADEVPKAIANYLRSTNLPLRVRAR